MRRFRVSIAGLMVVVVLVAVAAAALREASEIWAGVLFGLTLGLVGFAVLRAAYRQGRRRAFWAGFALFAGGYLAVCFLPASESRPRLATSLALGWLHQRLSPQPPVQFSVFTDTSSSITQFSSPYPLTSVKATVNTQAPAVRLWQVASGSPVALPMSFTSSPESFQHVGHCLLALLAGMLGGALGRWQQAGSGPADDGPTLTTTPTAAEEDPCPTAAN